MIKNSIKMIRNIFYFFLFVTMYSCNTSSKISNGAYSDISLNRDSKDYTITRLKEINKEEKAFFGIPTGKSLNKTGGMVVRFNGVNVNFFGSKRIWPILSMVALSVVPGMVISELGGRKEVKNFDFGNTYYYTEGKLNIPLGVGMLLATPITGFINNQIWQGIASSRATYNANSQLVNDNDDIDVFLNPKYQFKTKQGIFTQKSTINSRVMGAKIKTDN